jgi:hypothetical protein
MTLQEILNNYAQMKDSARRFNDWKKLDEFVEELAQLASGTPIVPEDLSEEIFTEVRPS